MNSTYRFLFISFSIACLAISIRFFEVAFPIINLDIKFTREQALQKAKLFHATYLVPNVLDQIGALKIETNYSQTAIFVQDQRIQHFVELDGNGGNEQFLNLLMQQNITGYHPFTWKIRHFIENCTEEAEIVLDERGNLNGFDVYLPDDRHLINNTSGLELEQMQNENFSLQIAIQTITSEPWNIKLSKQQESDIHYELVSSTKSTKPNSGRVEWIFVFECSELALGQSKLGKLRVTTSVSMSKVISLKRSVKVPDSFTKSYEEIKSYNKIVAFIASSAMFLVFGTMSVISFWIIWRNYICIVRWRRVVFSSMVMSFAAFFLLINLSPLQWMNYKTEISARIFMSEIVMQSVASFFAMSAVTILLFTVVEYINRSRLIIDPSTSFATRNLFDSVLRPSLDELMIGYGSVPIMFAYEIAFYWVAVNYFSWWVPSALLFEPNVLAHYLPWFSSVFLSSQAAILEECIFRAVPLGFALYVATKSKLRGLKQFALVGLIFFIQSFVFSAAHANYPNQP